MADKEEKLSRKDLKAPDEFQKIGAQAVPFLQQHQKTIVIASVGLVAVGLVIALVSYFGSKGNQKAQGEFGATLKVLARPVSATPSADPNAEVPFKTEKEKDEALVKELTEFREKHKGTKPAAAAGLPLAEALMRLEKPDEAIAGFDEFLKVADPKDPLRLTALEGKGYALEAKKDFAGAMAIFEQLSKETTGDFMKGMGLYHRARMLEAQGQKDAAAKAYVELPSQAANTAAARLGADRLSLLVANGTVKPPSIVPAAGPDAG